MDLPANAWSVRGYEYSLVLLMYSIFICHNACGPRCESDGGFHELWSFIY